LVENFLEEFLGAFAAQEVFLVRGFLVAVAGGEHHALDFQFHHFVKKFADAGGVCSFKEGGVGRDTESASDGFFNAFECGFVCAIATDGSVVFGLESVHMDAEGEIFGGFKEIDFAFEEEGVGAEVDVFFAGDEAFDDFIDLGMDEWFTSRDGDHGGPALIRCVPALLGGESFIKNVIRILNLTASCAGKVATEEGLEHEDKGIAFVAPEFLSENIRGNRPSLANRNWHRGSSEATNTIAYVNGT